MTNNFKPGDLALTVGLSDKNNFRTVELLRHVGIPDGIKIQGKYFLNSNLHDMWLVRSLNDPLLPSKKMQDQLGIGPMQEVEIPTRNLMPLRGHFTPEQKKAKEAV
ncbi:hypothetical protein CKQ80_23790 [Pseudomonas moraviensis]|uniref:Uncharacterized protein n=1 Tax=Pseudomonas moraviensis TaxID=321662 RepID=A0A2A2PRW0_9PSED|nr:MULTISPECIES: hypothetical protein [Pseudomonas fluorescens group]PAW51673.1 hypothetical protein CKQ68_05420 [Pseudomonas moraviensis]PAW58202.1 hypothetical protein CKQ80_23790 [Pseudomonas moraviensis]